MSQEFVKYFAEVLGGQLGEKLKDMAEAQEHSFCPGCEQPVSENDFKTIKEKKEFQISGFCPTCQKKIFGG